MNIAVFNCNSYSNSFKDKTEDGWVVTGAKTKVCIRDDDDDNDDGGKCEFYDLLEQAVSMRAWTLSLKRLKDLSFFQQVLAGEQLTFHYQGGLKVCNTFVLRYF